MNKLLTMINVLSFNFISVIIGISIPPIIAVWLDHYFNKKKKEAETKKIQLQNKITEEITYEQLKTEGKQKDIKGKIDIFQRLLELEEKIKNKKEKTVEDEKKLESLEMIRKEFKQFFEKEVDSEKTELVENNLETEKKVDKKLTKVISKPKRKK